MAFRLSTESLARACGRHPWLTIGVWVAAFLVAGFLIVSLLSSALTTDIDFTNNPESRRGFQLLEERLRGPQQINEIVIVQSDSLTVDDPAFQAYVEELYARIVGLGDTVIAGGASYYQTGDEALVSADRHTTIMPFVMAGDRAEANANIRQVHQVIEEFRTEGSFGVLITGGASISEDFQKVAENDLRVGEAFGIPAALVILVIVFGALVAAVVPVILGVISIVIATGVTALVGQAFELSFFVTNMITLMGLAVGIDYCLFIISRYREERGHGREKLDAITASGATASRAVLFSGMTVVLALTGMLLIPTTIFRSLGLGAILVVVTAVLASLTLLPAVLSVLGDKVDSLRIPIVQRVQSTYDEQRRGGFWDRTARVVMRRPFISLALAAGLLMAAAIPYFDIHTGFAGVSTLPDSLQSKQGFLVLNQEFSGGLVSPAEIVIDGDVSSPQVQQGIQRLQDILATDPLFGPGHLTVNDSGDLALLSVPIAGDAASDRAVEAIKRLRSSYIPQAFSGVAATVLVTGDTAFNVDFFDVAQDYQPIVFAFVLGLSFLLLMVVFRSLVVPLKAVIMNLLSVGAAYGLVVLVTQKGVGANLFGFQQVESVEAWIPLFLFCVLFGLSMDYHVFLLSRIRERFNQTQANSEAVAFGLRTTGRLITGAALIMVAVFSGFAAGDLVMFQQVGFGAAVAVLLDATIVRSVLVPATMQLLGKANWYLPPLLRWLPQMQVEVPEAAVVPVSDQPGLSSDHFRQQP